MEMGIFLQETAIISSHYYTADTAASALLEGNIIILVDNSPSAMILPTSIFDIVEEADDYYFPPRKISPTPSATFA